MDFTNSHIVKNDALDEKIENILNCLINEKKHVLLYGFGGTGKTYTLNTLIKLLINSGYGDFNNTFATAPTGIAALNLIRGMTLHKWSGVGIKVRDYGWSLAKIESNPFTEARWRNTKFLIIDEISMVSCEFFERIDLLAREVRRCDMPFGGIRLILSGDFLQLPPVKEKYVFTGTTFPEIFFGQNPSGKVFLFDTPYRFNDLQYFQLLSRFRIAQPIPEDIKLIESRLTARPDPNNPIKPTILYSKNTDVDHYNMSELNKLETKSFIFRCTDTYKPLKKNLKQIFKEYYEALFNEAIPETIELKVGAQVILKYNIRLEDKLANGSRGVITEIKKLGEATQSEKISLKELCQGDKHLNTEINTLVKVKFLNGMEIFVPWCLWEIHDDFVKAERSQIPLVLGWATTIHKSQGQTIDYVTTKIGKDIFLDGQMYVALSRLKNLESLFVTEFDPNKLKADQEALAITKKLESIAVNRPLEIEVEDEISDFEEVERSDSEEAEEILTFVRDKFGKLVLE